MTAESHCLPDGPPIPHATRIFALALTLAALAACGGGGGGSNGGGFTPPPPAGNVTVSGRITFDKPTVNPNQTLNLNQTQRLPARGVTVEIRRSSDQSLLATTVTDASGNYSATVGSIALQVQALAQMRASGAGGYDFEVRDNTAQSALYVLTGSSVNPGGSAITVDLNAPTGWGGSAYTGPRAAAPFAILDMFWRAKEMLRQASPGRTLPEIDVFWSTANRAGDCNGRPNPVSGEIGTSFFLPTTNAASGGCPAVPRGIYVMGDASGNADDDTDEFDDPVVLHEFGHFYEETFSRTESVGGPHALDSRLDLAVALSEGFGHAFQGYVTGEPVVRDTLGAGGQFVFWFDMENDRNRPFADVTGYFSEASAMDFLWDAFDPAGEPGDAMAFGFGPIDAAMSGPVRNSEAFTSIYVVAAALAAAQPGTEPAIRARLQAEAINGFGDFGTGENSSPGDPGGLPVYHEAVFGLPTRITSINQFADAGDTQFASFNRQGGRRYLRVVLPAAASLRIVLVGGSDPDFSLYRRGVAVCSGFSSVNGREEAVCPGLAAGTYVLEAYECTNLGELFCGQGPPRGTTPIDVTVTQQ